MPKRLTVTVISSEQIPKCAVLLDSPCAKHAAQLTCAHVFKHAPSAGPRDRFEAALEKFECPETVQVELPCGHKEAMACHKERAILDGRVAHPRCDRKSPRDYVHPACGHHLPAT